MAVMHRRSWAEASDEELLSAVAGGDRDAVGTLYDRHGAAVFSLAVRLTRDPVVAADVVQDVFVKAWLRASTFCPDRGDVRGWLLGITRRRVADAWRARADLPLADPSTHAPALVD